MLKELFIYFLRVIWKAENREEEKQNFHLLVHSPDACNSQGYTRLKSGARNSYLSQIIHFKLLALSWNTGITGMIVYWDFRHLWCHQYWRRKWILECFVLKKIVRINEIRDCKFSFLYCRVKLDPLYCWVKLELVH